MTDFIDDSYQRVYDLMKDIDELMDDAETAGAPEYYLDNCLETAQSITATVESMEEDNREPSEAQIKALENIKNGLEKMEQLTILKSSRIGFTVKKVTKIKDKISYS